MQSNATNFAPRWRHLVISNKQRCLMSECCHHLATWTKHMHHLWFGLFPPLYENMIPSTKPEVHDVLHCCQRRIKPQLQLTYRVGQKSDTSRTVHYITLYERYHFFWPTLYIDNWLKLWCVVFEYDTIQYDIIFTCTQKLMICSA